MNYKIAIYVQHLLGAGHLVRAMSLAEALSECGQQVLVLSGGFPIDRSIRGYQFYQLPPLRAIKGDFRRLVDERGHPVSEHWRNERVSQLLEEVRKFKPDLVITETFPFGRRQFLFELEPLLDWVQSQSSVRLMSSIRDILQRRTEAKNRLSVEIIERYYDAVLVHADEALFKLDASFPLSHEIQGKLIYTGYIHQAVEALASSPEKGNEVGQDEIIVSGGSGTVSTKLIETARLARPLSSASSRVWRLLTGRDKSGGAKTSEAGLIIEPNRQDFLAVLSRCVLSVSQAGYNTTLDVLASGARSVMVPFSGDGETEQSDRALALERAGRLVTLAEPDLTPQSLALAIDRALDMTPSIIPVNLNGAANSARLISKKLDEWRA